VIFPAGFDRRYLVNVLYPPVTYCIASRTKEKIDIKESNEIKVHIIDQ
jgi:hypothetical protein